MSINNLNIISCIGVLLIGIFCPNKLISSPIAERASFPFKIVNSLIIIEAEINGIEGHYILDTGTDAILLDGSPNESSQNITTPSGDIMTQNISLSSLKVGTYVKYSVEAHIVSLSVLKDQLGIDFSGIIGGKFFMPETLILDFKKSEITISSEVAQDDISDMNMESFTLVNQVPIIDIRIEGINYRFALDSGATSHFMSHAVLDHISNKTSLVKHSDIWTVQSKSVEDQAFVISSFSLGDVKFSGHHYTAYNLDHINKELVQPIDGILSLAEIAHEKIILDFHNHRLYF